MFGSNWKLRSFAFLALALLLINPAWADDDDDGHISIDQQAQALVDQMTQDEKLQLTMGHPDAANPICGNSGTIQGIPRLGIPHLYFTDGPQGVSREGPLPLGPGCPASNPNVGRGTTRLPALISLAASFDVEAAGDYGVLMGQELRDTGFNWLGGTGNVNLTRDPRNGRTFETMGEDPILSGLMVAHQLSGIKESGVVASLKHYAVNDQDIGRFSLNAKLDERAMRETDLLAFEIPIRESGVQSIMCSYNLVNAEFDTNDDPEVNNGYACGNDHLLNDILKGEWGFQGFVHTDWFTGAHSVLDANGGLDVEMPGYGFLGAPGFFASGLEQAIIDGDVSQARLDDMAKRVVIAMLEADLIDKPALEPVLVDQARGEAVALATAEKGSVLLKNSNAALPLGSAFSGTIAVIGSNADVGVLTGGGSSNVNPIPGYATTPPVGTIDLRYNLWANLVGVVFSKRYDAESPLAAIDALSNATVLYDPGTDLASATALADSADISIVFVHNWSSEGMDLESLSLGSGLLGISCSFFVVPCEDQDQLVSAVAAVSDKTIVVVQSGGAVLMPWVDEVDAVLAAWLPGIKGGEAIANLLFGQVNPSGKLPLTFPLSEADLPRTAPPSQQTDPVPCMLGDAVGLPIPPCNIFDVDYNIEGLEVGYKWFDAKGKDVLFPFGHGLSYTDFEYSKLRVTPRKANGKSDVKVKFKITNTGDRAGAEAAQVYVELPAAANEPPKRLVGFKKVHLQPGETQEVAIKLEPLSSSHPFSYFDVDQTGESGEWVMAEGIYKIHVGSSSRDIRLEGDFCHGDDACGNDE
jgi:beta-glucosidase